MVTKLLPLVVIFLAVNAKSFNISQEWENYKATFNKSYSSVLEEVYRRAKFAENLKRITEHNEKHQQGLVSYKLGLNKYSDEDVRVLKRQRNGFQMSFETPISDFSYTEADLKNLPESVDWRAKGWVTPVKDQGQCGSCWAFSTVASIEGQHANVTGKLVSLSEQQLVDCSFLIYLNFGCYGGQMSRAFTYVQHSKGLDTEASYPYKAKYEWGCKASSGTVGAKISGHISLPRGDENALKVAVANIGPISVAIDANHDGFMHYSSGVFSESSCSTLMLDHGVTVVGYGTENGTDYWLVKNSWGETWGEAGYVKMARNKGNMCGIASSAAYPIAEKA